MIFYPLYFKIKLFRNVLCFVGSVCAQPFVAPSARSAEDLGWKAGEVAPSPLAPRYTNPTFKTKPEAEEAKRVAQEELKRCQKIRLHQKALCNEKLLVNQCMGKVEKVLRERERLANQLVRTADHQIRIFTTQEKKKKSSVGRDLMPQKRGDISEKIAKSNKKLKVQEERKLQEQANVEAFNAKQIENEARKEKLAKEAAKRKADRQERQARYEKERREREEAQRRQAESNQKSGVLF